MTDSTPTTPLDLDAAIEAGVESVRSIIPNTNGVMWTSQHDGEPITLVYGMRAALTAIGYAALVEEAERLRAAHNLRVIECKKWRDEQGRLIAERDAAVTERGVVLAEFKQLRADRDAAIARAEAAEALLRAIEDSRLDPARAIIKADALAGEAIIRAHNAERTRDEALAKIAAGLALADEWSQRDHGRIQGFGNRLRAALTEVQAGAEASGATPAPVDDREALAAVIRDALSSPHPAIIRDRVITDAILAAGYVKGGQV